MHRELVYQSVAAFLGLCRAWRRLDDTRTAARARRRAVESPDPWHEHEVEDEDRYQEGTDVLSGGFESLCTAVSRMTMALRDDLELHHRLQHLAQEVFFGDNLTLQDRPWDVDEAVALVLTMFACSSRRYRMIRVQSRAGPTDLPDKLPWIAMAVTGLLYGRPWLNRAAVAELDEDLAIGRRMIGRIQNVFAAQQLRVMPYVPDGAPGVNGTDEVVMATAVHLVEVYARYRAPEEGSFGSIRTSSPRFRPRSSGFSVSTCRGRIPRWASTSICSTCVEH